jgi:nucleoside-diphosphate-sugar epimerase
MAETVVEIAGSGRLNFMEWPSNYAQFETGDFVADISRLESQIGKWPRVSLADGLRETLKHNKANDSWE